MATNPENNSENSVGGSPLAARQSGLWLDNKSILGSQTRNKVVN
jgi:hypothetical protein